MRVVAVGWLFQQGRVRRHVVDKLIEQSLVVGDDTCAQDLRLHFRLAACKLPVCG